MAVILIFKKKNIRFQAIKRSYKRNFYSPIDKYMEIIYKLMV